LQYYENLKKQDNYENLQKNY